MFPFFGTFVVVSALTFAATLYSMNMRRRSEFNSIQAPSSLIQTTTTEAVHFPDISDAVCDCISVTSCKTLAQKTDHTKYCGPEENIKLKICCPIDFSSNSVDISNRLGSESKIDKIINSANYEESLDNTDTDSENLAAITELPDSADILSRSLVSERIINQDQDQNQTSFKTHRNFQLLPYWNKCGIAFVNSSNLGIRKTRIVGGEKVDLNSFPYWIVRLGFLHKNGSEESIVYKCAGTVLNQRYVLSAAHCATNYGTPVKILVQTSDGGNISLNAEKIILHPAHNKSRKLNDIMLIRLGENNLTTSNNNNSKSAELTPICLPFFTEYGVDPTTLHKNSDYVLGWGVHTWNSTKLSDNLRKLLVPIIPNPICSKMYGNYFQVAESQICAGGVIGKDTCSGDSGGFLGLSFDDPNLNQDPVHVQIGITSFGSKLCGKGVPGVYTRISHYLQWILDSIES